MNASLAFQDPSAFESPLMVAFAVDLAAPHSKDCAPALLTRSAAVVQAADGWLTEGEFKASLADTLLLHAPAALAARRLLIVGLGKGTALTLSDVRKAAGAAVRFARSKGIRELAFAFPEAHELPSEEAARVLAEGFTLADFDIDTYRSDRKDKSLQKVTLLASAPAAEDRQAIERGFQAGLIVGESQNFARVLVNEPGNVLTPTELARRAQAMAQEVELACELHSTEKMQELGMGAFLAVAQGSAEAPALIVLRYEPENAMSDELLGLVGKGITFDTGGISIKPADGMDKMKYDMAGAAAMLGAMRSIALLKPAVRVVCVLCSCENMPGGKAYKPGDVLRAMSGKTIEVLNTDAEGRLVLADGLHYAKTLGATRLINAATLTGAVSIALGHVNAGLFSNNDAEVARFDRGLAASGEKFWRLPCTDDYRDAIKSSIADIMNTGGTRYGGATNGAMFLKEFVGETPWIHLDIAGMAWVDDAKAWSAKGPSGVAVRSIVEWVRSYAE